MPDTTLIEVADTAIKIGLGALIGILGAYGLEVYRRGQDRRKEAEQRYRENLEKPVTAFVDEALTLIGRAYWNRVDGKDPGITQLLDTFREKEALVEARLAAMENQALLEAFRAVDASFIRFRGELAEGSPIKARDCMKEAQARAGDLFRILYGVEQ